MLEEQRYIDTILNVSLQLREGEALSINSGERNMSFAQKVAQKAVEISGIPVKIVSIEEGEVKEVFTVDPVHKEMIAEDSQSKVLLYLSEPLDLSILEDNTLKEIAHNPPLLQGAGNLCPPQLDRPVAPFAIAPVPTASWARRIYSGEKEPLRSFWSFLSSFLPLGDTFLNDWITVLRRNVALVKAINALSPTHLIIKQEEHALSLPLLATSQARQSLHHLPPDRVFLPRISARGISFLTDPKGSEGTIRSSLPFRLLAERVKDLSLIFSEGNITSYDANTGMDAVQEALSIDEKARKIGLCTLVEELTDTTHFPDDIPPEFMGSVSSFITLGGGESNHLKNLDLYENEEDLQEKTGMNISLLKADIPFGSRDTDIDMIDRDGHTVPLMRDGKFVLYTE